MFMPIEMTRYTFFKLFFFIVIEHLQNQNEL